MLGLAAASPFGAAAVFLCLEYPLWPWPLAVGLLSYAAILWRWPVAFLLILPTVLPAFDFGLWTGWMVVGESDLFVLVSLAVLLIRTPPVWCDLLPRGRGGLALAAVATSWLIATVVGLLSPLGAEASDNPFLSPDNALRLGKGLAEALVLMPFLIQRHRLRGDAVLRLGQGVAAGLLVVTLIVLAERLLYSGIFDISGDYRVAGPFSSMRVGGGHIGAYAALALPFVLALVELRPRPVGALLCVAGLLGGGYTLAVSFARTAYAAGAVGMVVTGLASPRGRRGGTAASVGSAATLLVLAGLAAAVVFTGMRERFAQTSGEFTTREGNWRAGLAVRDTGVLPTLFGMGLGTYQRAMLVRSPVNKPSDLILRRFGDTDMLEMRIESPFFLGQKVITNGTQVHAHLQARPIDRPNTVGVSLCDKVLLYSDNCQGGEIALPVIARWETLNVELPTAALGAGALGGWLHRLVEFSVAAHHGRIEVRDIRLTDAAGHELLANGDFSAGLDRWLFTDDSHVSWRMLNVYLMLFFETGVLGLAAYLALAGFAMIGGLAAARAGIAGAAPVVGAVAGFLVSGLFDNVLEAPRIATLFFLVCICGLIARPQSVPDAVLLTPDGA